jgi:uncharacterized protein YxeA
MKKTIATLLALVLCIGMLTGCGTNYATEESTVFVQKDGKVVSTDVESFSDSYDEEELKNYVETTISEYTAQYGEDSVTLKDVAVADGKATLILSYASPEDYSRFNGIELFTGSIAEALAAGYKFDVDFADVTGDTPTACSASDFTGEDGYKVVVIKTNANVNVSGKICYVSQKNVSLVDKKTISIAVGNQLIDGAAVNEETEEVEKTTEAAPEEVVDEGSVSEDEILTGEDEDTEIVFDFGEEEEPYVASENSSYSSVYTYIIYK